MNRVLNSFFSPPGSAPSLEEDKGYLYAAHEVLTPTEGAAAGQGPENQEPIVFECIVARADGHLPSYLGWSGRQQHQLAILELGASALPPPPPGVEPGDVLWYQFFYSRAPQGEGDGLLYLGLFGEGVPVRLDLAQGGGPTVNQVPAGVDIPRVQGRPMLRPVKTRLRLEFDDLDTTGGVIAYDVGQGACHAALNQYHRPSLYIDFGGGVTGNTHTFPSEFRGFCFTGHPTIILTHWDWDHWSSALRQPSALDAQWIAPPLKKPLPIQAAFAKELADRGSLHLWTATAGNSLRTKPVTIERCTGKTSNDSGLSVVLKLSGTRKRFLIPGDASYHFIPSACSASGFDGLSMTHHGGVLHGNAYPSPKSRAAAIISVGATNSHEHPRVDTLETHLSEKWPLPLATGFSGQRPCHAYVAWGEQPRLGVGGCYGQECATAIHKVVPALAGVSLCMPATTGPFLPVSAPKPKGIGKAVKTSKAAAASS